MVAGGGIDVIEMMTVVGQKIECNDKEMYLMILNK
jgi:hypothetical protein